MAGFALTPEANCELPASRSKLPRSRSSVPSLANGVPCNVVSGRQSFAPWYRPSIPVPCPPAWTPLGHSHEMRSAERML